MPDATIDAPGFAPVEPDSAAAASPADVAFQQPPVTLAPAEAAWLLEEGEVDVFAVPATAGDEEEGEGGARLFVCRATAGTILLGQDGFLENLLAVPAAGARLRPLEDPLNDLPPARLVAGLEAWSGALNRGIAEILWRPAQTDALARAGSLVALDAGKSVMVQDPFVWCFVPAPGALLMEQEVVQGLIPLPHRAWLKAMDPVRIPFGRFPAPADLPHALAGARALTAACGDMLLTARGLSEADEIGRLTLRAAREREEEDRLVDGAAKLLHADGRRKKREVSAAEAAAEISGRDPLFAVMRLVAAAACPRIRLRRPTLLRERDLDAQPNMEEIARASGVHVRPVTLSEGWRRRHLGPLLARTLDGLPRALLPKKGGYEIVSPDDPKPVRLTAEIAATLETSAWTLVEPLPDRPQTIGSLMRFVKVPASFWIMTLAAALMGAILGLASPFGMKFAFSALIPARNHPGLLELGVLLACVAAMSFAVQLIGEIARQSMQTMREAGLHAGLWDRVLRLPMPVLRRFSAGDLSARVGMGLALPLAAQGFIVVGASSFAVLAASVFAMGYFHAGAAVIAAAVLAVQIIIAGVAAWLRARVYKVGESLNGQAESLAMQFLTGVGKLRLAAAEHWALAHWAERFIGMRGKRLQVQQIEGWTEAIDAALPVLAMSAVFLVFWASDTAASPLDSGNVAALLTAFSIASGAAHTLGMGFGGFYQLYAARAYAEPLLQTAPEPTLGRIDPGRLSGQISVGGVYFGYEGAETPIFSNLNLQINAGEYIAILGKSGCGKSTLIRLLLGLERPRVGSVAYDGNDIGSLDLGLLRRRIGTVLQGAQLPPGALIDVVRGLSDADEKEIWAALKAAAVDEEIRAMPLGVRTPIVDAARSLSGGQAQRLMLARALVTRPDVLILDEATSALDNVTQAATVRTLKSLPCTRIVIAHRLETIRDADRIVVLEGGRVAHAGTFDDLRERGVLHDH